MLLLFRRNDFVGLFILIFVAFILRLAYLINPPAITELGNFYTNTFGTFNWLRDLYSTSPRFYILLSSVFWLLFSLLFKQVLVDEKLVRHRDFTSSIAIFMITSALPPFIIFSVTALSASCLFFAFTVVLGTAYNKAARSRYFLIGFFVGLATALYWPAVIVFFAILFTLLSIRMFILQEILALIMGLFFPLYLIFALHYVLTGHAFSISNLALSLHLPVGLQYKVGTLIFSLSIILITFYGIYISRNKIAENKIQIIKKWNGVVLFLIFSLLVAISSSVFPDNTFVFVLIPFSIILSSALINSNQKYNTFTFYFVFIAVLALQWVLRFI